MGEQKKNVVFSILQKIDLYGIQFPFHYKKETEFSSRISIIMSLISIIFISSFLIYYFIILFEKKGIFNYKIIFSRNKIN